MSQREQQNPLLESHRTRTLLLDTIIRERAFRRSLPSRVDVDAVFSYGACVGSVIEWHQYLDRAMDRARQLIVQVEEQGGSFASGTVILAESMQRSKGRFDRIWHAPQGGLWGCVVLANTLLPQSQPFVSLAVGLACCQAIHFYGGYEARIRWVNDVLFGNEKVAGFLIETYQGPRYGETYSLIGFGINVNNTCFPEELAGIAISLRQVLKYSVDLEEFCALFLAKLSWNLGLVYYEESCLLHEEPLSAPGGQHQLLYDWLRCSDSIGRRVCYGFDVLKSPEYEAMVTGVASDGGLILRRDDGSSLTVHSGEIRYV